jgi:hypothetical protein
MLSKLIPKVQRSTLERMFSVKFYNTADEAIFDIKDGSTVAVGGFG